MRERVKLCLSNMLCTDQQHNTNSSLHYVSSLYIINVVENKDFVDTK